MTSRRAVEALMPGLHVASPAPHSVALPLHNHLRQLAAAELAVSRPAATTVYKPLRSRGAVAWSRRR